MTNLCVLNGRGARQWMEGGDIPWVLPEPKFLTLWDIRFSSPRDQTPVHVLTDYPMSMTVLSWWSLSSSPP